MWSAERGAGTADHIRPWPCAQLRLGSRAWDHVPNTLGRQMMSSHHSLVVWPGHNVVSEPRCPPTKRAPTLPPNETAPVKTPLALWRRLSRGEPAGPAFPPPGMGLLLLWPGQCKRLAAWTGWAPGSCSGGSGVGVRDSAMLSSARTVESGPRRPSLLTARLQQGASDPRDVYVPSGNRAVILSRPGRSLRDCVLSESPLGGTTPLRTPWDCVAWRAGDSSGDGVVHALNSGTVSKGAGGLGAILGGHGNAGVRRRHGCQAPPAWVGVKRFLHDL